LTLLQDALAFAKSIIHHSKVAFFDIFRIHIAKIKFGENFTAVSVRFPELLALKVWPE